MSTLKVSLLTILTAASGGCTVYTGQYPVTCNAPACVPPQVYVAPAPVYYYNAYPYYYRSYGYCTHQHGQHCQ